jgi:sugar phosphate isomerase/epimerase
MRLGIFTKTFDGSSPSTVLYAAKAAGYSVVQYNMACSGLAAMPDEISKSSAREVTDASKSTSIDIVAVSGTYNMIHPDIAIRNSGHARLEAMAARCSEMQTNVITLCTGTRDTEDQWRGHPENSSTESWRDLLNAMEMAIRIADKYDIYLGIEPELSNVVSSAEKAKNLIMELQSRRLKIILDPANLFEIEIQSEQQHIVSSAIDLLGDHIAIAHAKDRTATGNFATAGQGCLDYPHYFKALRAVGFEGAMVTHGLKAEEAPDVAKYLRSVASAVGLRVE